MLSWCTFNVTHSDELFPCFLKMPFIKRIWVVCQLLDYEQHFHHPNTCSWFLWYRNYVGTKYWAWCSLKTTTGNTHLHCEYIHLANCTSPFSVSCLSFLSPIMLHLYTGLPKCKECSIHLVKMMSITVCALHRQNIYIYFLILNMEAFPSENDYGSVVKMCTSDPFWGVERCFNPKNYCCWYILKNTLFTSTGNIKFHAFHYIKAFCFLFVN